MRAATVCGYLCLCFPLLLHSQALGNIQGVVIDANGGQTLGNVEVTLLDASASTRSDASGHFYLRNIPAGDYTLIASTIGYNSVKNNLHLTGAETKDFVLVLAADSGRRSDTVSVHSGSVFNANSDDTPAPFSLTGTELRNLTGVLADDPLRAVQAIPGVTSNNDFEARFSLRGADFSRVGIYLDGILLHDPLHTFQGTDGSSASSSVFNANVIERLDLYDGAYAEKFGDSTAGALDVQMRDGDRDAFSVRISATFAGASLTMEGPLDKWKRCSWIAGYRKSYLQYILERTLPDPSMAFGVQDGQGRLSCDVNPQNSISLEVVDSNTDLNRSSVKNQLGLNSLMLANQDFALGALGWRYTPNENFSLSNHVAWMEEWSGDQNPGGLSLDSQHYREWVANSNAAWMWNSKNPLEFGSTVRSIEESGYANEYFPPLVLAVQDSYRGTGLLAGGYLQQSWTALGSRLHLSASARWDHHSADGITAFSPQASLAYGLFSSTQLQLAWGQYAQFPDMAQFSSNLGSTSLRPMRSTQSTAGIEQRLSERVRIRAEFYNRQDRDLLYQPLFFPRLLNGSINGMVNTRIFNPPATPQYENSLRGTARGFEVFLQRVSANGLTGWVSYSYGNTSMYDSVTNTSFPSEWDQRHTVNAYASYRIRPTANLSVKWTYGGGFPIPGYLQKQGSDYYLSAQANQLRLPYYSRLDVRINKSWVHAHWKTTLYGEVMNVLNRTNYSFDSFNGYNNVTGQAYVSLYQMFPILPSLGVNFER